MSEALKQKHELDIFLRFARLARIKFDRDSVASCAPPRPDIVCTVDGCEYGFELTALTDVNIERQFGTGDFHYTNYRIGVADVVRCVERKAEKIYSVDHVDLVIHEGGTPVDDLWISNQWRLDTTLLEAATRAPFRRIWLVDFSSQIVRCCNGNFEVVSGMTIIE